MQAKLDNRYLSKFVCGRENPCEHKAAGLRISVVEFYCHSSSFRYIVSHQMYHLLTTLNLRVLFFHFEVAKQSS